MKHLRTRNEEDFMQFFRENAKCSINKYIGCAEVNCNGTPSFIHDFCIYKTNLRFIE